MKLGNIAKVAVAAAGVAAGAGAAVYGSRAATMASIRQIAPADGPYGLYAMDVSYRYDLDRIIERGLGGDQGNMDAILAEALPLVPVHMQTPQFGCSAFTLASGEGVFMGRNYDFKFDTSAMLVHTAPADGYESIGFCALDNLGVVEGAADEIAFRVPGGAVRLLRRREREGRFLRGAHARQQAHLPHHRQARHLDAYGHTFGARSGSHHPASR